jgi:hypothetical protein
MRNLSPGRALKEVACEMDISINTVHAHVRSIRSKLSLDSTNEVLAYASRFFSDPDRALIHPQQSKNGTVALEKSPRATASPKHKKTTRRK